MEPISFCCVPATSPIVVLDARIWSVMLRMISPTSSVAFLVFPASRFTSSATTAKHLPAAPALAASIAALMESRFVWRAIVPMVFVIPAIFAEDSMSDLFTSPTLPAFSLPAVAWESDPVIRPNSSFWRTLSSSSDWTFWRE